MKKGASAPFLRKYSFVFDKKSILVIFNANLKNQL